VQPRERQRYRKLLLTKLEELSATRGKNESVVPAAGEHHGDLVDQANSETEAELQIQLHQSDGQLMRSVEEALVRLNKDTFGVCVNCRRPISKARLKAVPWTHHCIACKEKQGV
jgi:RNA polymerase-binding transcription factor